jgi:hypothetical protein
MPSQSSHRKPTRNLLASPRLVIPGGKFEVNVAGCISMQHIGNEGLARNSIPVRAPRSSLFFSSSVNSFAERSLI